MFEVACLFYTVRRDYWDAHRITGDTYTDACSEIARLAEAAGGNINLAAQLLAGTVGDDDDGAGYGGLQPEPYENEQREMLAEYGE